MTRFFLHHLAMCGELRRAALQDQRTLDFGPAFVCKMTNQIEQTPGGSRKVMDIQEKDKEGEGEGKCIEDDQFRCVGQVTQACLNLPTKRNSQTPRPPNIEPFFGLV